ncbi:adenosine deaminase-like protein [Chrysoperla carnea]|uniref:adenosine deaminase-like protein n=1 Tax=Chrysoperla carnea TaxID=189513 RepID=UPI001D07D1D9|nr:adenosine deaminase-like protein [Chrysoperla carnea]
MDIKTFCNKLPKIELHAHLNGSLSESTLKKLYELANLPMDAFGLIFQPNPNRNLQEWFFMFDLVYKATNSPLAMTIATKEVIEDFAKDNVIYLELRTTPRSIPNKMTKKEYLDAIITGVNEAVSLYPIIVKLIISINRSKKDEDEIFDLAMEYHKKYPNLIVGIDIGGNPISSDWKPELLKKAREYGFRIVIHTAEVPRETETMEILKFKPDRIGHGTCIHPRLDGSDTTWKLLCESQIPVECCLTSNVCCQVYDGYANSHLKELIADNLPFTLGTDDKGIFLTNLSEEYEHAAETFNLNKTKLWKISNNSVDYSFATEKEKDDLHRILRKWKEENLFD